MAFKKKLYRSRSNRVLTGLCGGIGDYFNIDATTVRVVAVILELVTAGFLLIGYLIVSIIVPLEPATSTEGRKKVINIKK